MRYRAGDGPSLGLGSKNRAHTKMTKFMSTQVLFYKKAQLFRLETQLSEDCMPARLRKMALKDRRRTKNRLKSHNRDPLA